MAPILRAIAEFFAFGFFMLALFGWFIALG